MGDIVFHVADKSMEMGLRAFFGRPNWSSVLKCGEFQIDPTSSDDIFRIPKYNDGGVWKFAASNLANHFGRFDRAVVILDEHFDPWPGAAKIYTDIERNMLAAGWPRDRFEVIVIQPMLEAWLWAGDQFAGSAFGIADFSAFRYQLIAEGLWVLGQWKPNDMKGARDRAMAAGGRLTSNILFNTVFEELTTEALDECNEPGFKLLRQRLQQWFPIVLAPVEGGAA
jgi:hypothetical protein